MSISKLIQIEYCLSCGRESYVEHGRHGKLHMKNYRNEMGLMELDWCEGPFATSAPIELTEQEWESIFHDAPTDEELMQMDENADEMFD